MVMKVSELKVGQTVLFSKVAPGSYCSLGAAYCVESIGRRAISFRNIEKGSGTFDSKSLLRFAEFEVVA